MAGILLIRDLAVVLVVAGLAAWVCQRLGLSAVVGYLVAGAVVGPFTPPFALVTDLDRIQTLAQIGLVFLIFGIGLNLGLNRLKRLGISTLVVTAIGALLVLCGCRVFGWALGWSTIAALFLAGMLMVSSSAIISKVLEELNLSHERPAQLALAVTVFEDIIAITMLTVLSSLTQFGKGTEQSILPTVATLGGFIVLLLVLSLLIVPKLLRRLSRNAEPEIRTLVVGGILLSLSWLAVRLGYSLALGAFIFGVIVGSTQYKSDIERSFDGLRQLFGAVFFVAVGMLVDFRLFLEVWPLMLGVTALALVLRPLATSLGFIAVGHASRESIQAGLSLTPLGEFTFVIAQLGVETGALPKSFYPVAAGAALLTALASPVLTKHAATLSGRIVGAEPRFAARWLAIYREWLGRLQGRTAGILWQLARKRLLQIGLHMMLVTALLLFIRPVHETIVEHLKSTGNHEPHFPFVFWTLFGLVLLGPLIAIWRSVSALTMLVADAATTGTPHQSTLRPVLERVLNLLALVLLNAWLLSVLPSGWSIFGAAGGVLLLLLLVATVFWRRFVKFHTRFEVELVDQLHRATQVTSASSWPDMLPQSTREWDVEIDEITLPTDSPHLGKTLRELSFRRKYGCTVVGIDRQGYSIVNPSADTMLYPRDKVLLLGGRTELFRASRELLATNENHPLSNGFDDLTMETVQVPQDCPMAGKPLLELDLIRKFHVQIGGIRHGSHSNVSPSGTDRFEAGDHLLLLGAHNHIDAFRQVLRSGGGPESPQRIGG